jgi:hypothetical protein
LLETVGLHATKDGLAPQVNKVGGFVEVREFFYSKRMMYSGVAEDVLLNMRREEGEIIKNTGSFNFIFFIFLPVATRGVLDGVII